ncbi:MAG: hypothetical protein AAF488_03540 [Planctomycetota bacterium]
MRALIVGVVLVSALLPVLFLNWKGKPSIHVAGRPESVVSSAIEKIPHAASFLERYPDATASVPGIIQGPPYLVLDAKEGSISIQFKTKLELNLAKTEVLGWSCPQHYMDETDGVWVLRTAWVPESLLMRVVRKEITASEALDRAADNPVPPL